MLNHKNKFSTFCSSLKISPEMARTALIIFILVVGVTFSLMRYAAKDETGFLIEAATMSDCMLEGRWFGDEAVGWHGFLFKIPAAVLFTIFGRSIFLATFTNVIIAALTCWLCFGILRKVLKSTVWAFAGTWLVITTYHFVLSLPTFLRDIPVMFAVLLLLSAIINKRNKWLIGLCMMLILDAKEGVFFAFAPGFVLWVVLSELCSRWERSESVIRDPWSVVRNSNSDPGGVKNSTGQGNRGLKTDAEEGTVGSKQFAVSSRQLTGRGSRTSDLALRPFTSLFRFFERLFAGFFPALVFLILMFCTSVVPLNMLTATVFGVTTSGMHDMKFNFSSKRATRSLKRYMKLKDDTVKSERLKVESKTKEADPGGVEDSTGQGDGGRKTEAGLDGVSLQGAKEADVGKLGGSEAGEETVGSQSEDKTVGSLGAEVRGPRPEVRDSESVIRDPLPVVRKSKSEDKEKQVKSLPSQRRSERLAQPQAGFKVESDTKGAVVRGPKSEVRSPKTEDRGQKTDAGEGTVCSQQFAVGRKEAEVQDPRSEARNSESVIRDPLPVAGGEGTVSSKQSAVSSSRTTDHGPRATDSNSRLTKFVVYFKKLLFPRTFSFIAMPKIIVIPALFMSIVMLRRFWKQGKRELLALPLFLWSYMGIYIIRESHGRYLMPVLPLLALFFAFFMIDGLKKRWFPIIVLIICAVMIGFGFMFEIKFVGVKICFNVILISFAVLALIGYRNSWRTAKIFALAVPLFTGMFAVSTALASSLTMADGQIRHFFRYGYNMEVEKVVAEFENVEKFWLNGFASGYVMWFYMDERLTTGERIWRLAKWVPKKNLLRRYDGDQHRRIGARIRSMERFRKKIMANNITKVGLVISTYPKQKFSYQDRLDDFNKADWLEFERKVEFKNKELHVFDVVNTNLVSGE